GTGWAGVRGGWVNGNNLVKPNVAFAAPTASKIRVVINAAKGSYSMLTEIEAWTVPAASPPLTPSTTTLASSSNPSTVGASTTFTAAVSGSSPTGSVSFSDGGNSIGGCVAVPLAGSGSTRTAQCSTSTLSHATHSVVASYTGDAGNTSSQSAPLSQVVNGGGGGGAGINVALAANGGLASASSSAYPASAVNNGDRAGLNFSGGGVWMDTSPGLFPDWVEIDFNGAKTIDHVIVYSVQDKISTPVDPSDPLTLNRYGLPAFDVQSWNGSGWVTLGSVSGNNLVKRSVAFAATTTSKIRVVINAAKGSYSMLTEIEAWTH